MVLPALGMQAGDPAQQPHRVPRVGDVIVERVLLGCRERAAGDRRRRGSGELAEREPPERAAVERAAVEKAVGMPVASVHVSLLEGVVLLRGI